MSSFQREREAIGQRLRELRLDARLTGRQLAAAHGWQPSKVSKIEAGKQTPSDDDLAAWARACDASAVLGDLVASLRTLDSHYIQHRREFRAGMARAQRQFGELEAETRFLRNFESTYIPGLLQTADYARAQLADDSLDAGQDIDEAVASRMARQQVLYRADKKFHLVITEAALRYRLAPQPVLIGQLDRLVSVASVQTIRFGIVPFETRYRYATPGHGFAIYDDKIVRVETLTAELKITEPTEIDEYLGLFADLGNVAVYGAHARAILARVLAELSAADQ